jgi:hypothetical protein
VALLPVLAGLTGTGALEPRPFAAGFRTAVVIAAAACAVGGLLAAAVIRDHPEDEPTDPPARRWHCAVDGVPVEPTGPGS